VASNKSNGKPKKEDLVSLYEQSYSKVAQSIYVRVGNQPDAEDLASETFLRAMRSLDSYQERGLQMEAWVFKIAHNLVIDHLRKNGNHKTAMLDEEAIEGEDDLSQTVEIDIQVDNLMEALTYLPPMHREIIFLRFFAGFSATECSDILGKTPGTVRAMQCTAIKSLRKTMGQGNGCE